MASFDVSSILQVVGQEHFTCRRVRSGNFQVQLRRLVERNATGMTDTEKIRLLASAVDKLQEAGYPAEARLTFRNAQGEWQNWPCIWVNATPAQSTVTPDLLARIEENSRAVARLAQLMTASLEAQGISLPQEEAPAEPQETAADYIVEEDVQEEEEDSPF